MALLKISLYSQKLCMQMPVSVILPQNTQGQIGMDNSRHTGKYKVLYLLHGLSDDDSVWLRRTRIDVLAERYDIAIVMPAAHRSWYQDTASGLRYFNYICEELPEICNQFFHFSNKREDTFIAGNSMGGYGAMRCGLWRYDRFGAVYSFSGALDIANIAKAERFDKGEMQSVFGDVDAVSGSESDIMHLANEHAQQNFELPRLYACCGKDDFLIEMNRKFANHMKDIGIAYDYLEDQGAHDWDYWEAHLEVAIRKLLSID